MIAAPTTVVRLNATGARLSPREVSDLYRDNPSLLFFCGFSGVVRATLADGKTPTGRGGGRGTVVVVVVAVMVVQVVVADS